MQKQRTCVTCVHAYQLKMAAFNILYLTKRLSISKEPERALRELYRVLAPGGRIICTVPLLYEEHEQPYGFFRYTQFSLRHLFLEVGFQIERIEWMEGFFGTCAYMLQTIALYLPWRYRRSGLLWLAATPFLVGTKALAPFCTAVLSRLDLKWKATNTRISDKLRRLGC